MTAAREKVENKEQTWAAGPHGHVNNLSMQRSAEILLGAIFNRETGENGVVYDCPTKTKSILLLDVVVLTSTSEFLVKSAFCVSHTCRGDMKRDWDLLFTCLLSWWCPQDIYIYKGQVPCPCC